jgi:S-adenosylmethionine:tRNA ribosyltransferase-isomerase
MTEISEFRIVSPNLLTSDFDYHLPPELIAQKPLPQRDDSRMMVVRRRQGEIIHARFKDLPEYLGAGDVLILNNTKVIPAKAWGKKDARDVEFLFLKERQKGIWEVLCRPAKRVRLGDTIFFSPGFQAQVVGIEARGKRLLDFSSGDVLAELHKIGYAPLPPYIKRAKTEDDQRTFDLERYQTVFARKEGAIAAPTAGLHFTPKSLKGLKTKGVQVCTINLKVGLATFQPMEAERIEGHRMLEESYAISLQTAKTINRAKEEGRTVVAVGTTVVRTLESAWQDGRVREGSRSTGLFIYPGFRFRVVDRLLTNFHLPKSTLLMLVSAFAGRELVLKAYAEAVREKYRFYSYGDCMLIL